MLRCNEPGIVRHNGPCLMMMVQFMGIVRMTFVIGKTGKIEKSWLSLAGTVRNCAGGQTPWKSWITCEETYVGKRDGFQRDHGFF